MQEMEIPKTIYKYESFNAYSLKNLKAQAIYMASPLRFNDPYDCALSTILHEMSDDDLDKIVSHYVNQENVPIHVKKQFLSLSKTDLRAMLFRTMKTTFEQTKQQFLELKGVSCFSEKKDVILMWAHYGDCYQGFCLEFRTDIEPFNKLKKVQYTVEIPRINIVSCLIEKNFDHITHLYCTKSLNWQYEQEWRLFHQEAGTLYHYPAKALKAIYFGPSMDGNIIEIICLIIQGQNPDVEFWKGKLSKTEFKIEFDKFNYIPHVVAKKMGLI